MYVYSIMLLISFSVFADTLDLSFSNTLKSSTEVETSKNDLSSIVPGQVVVALTTKFVNLNSKLGKLCVYFKNSTSTRPGNVTYLTIDKDQSCETFIMDKRAKTLFASVSNFNYEYDSDIKEFLFNVDRKTYSVTLTNSPEKYQFKALDSKPLLGTKTDYLWSGTGEGGLKKTLKDGTRCFDVDDNCNITTPNECQRCENGFYQVKASKCNTALRKYCGRKECGVKGHPACIRGVRASKVEEGDYCIYGSPVGLCHRPSQVQCVDKELFCR